MPVFVTGTDTGVGKTITSGYILKKYHQKYKNLRYWKPVQTGFPPDDDAKTVLEISNLSESWILPGWKYRAPVSPHFAAELENTEVPLSTLKEAYYNYSKEYSLLIEGAGGILVPLSRTYLWIDWVQELKIPVLIVARSTLGTINHTLLTVEALSKRNIPIIGIVFCGRYDEPYIHDNRKIISELTKLPVISYFDIHKDTNIDVDPNFIIEKYL
ncbi:MAG: dethiobiotin synthase [Leptospiraceae bacterium]|nr:dethiobiotin synthase [Leptospiraceae bacterium]MDW7976335.1 dethiobiotin synthase [Leptospiraceae bacterium]